MKQVFGSLDTVDILAIGVHPDDVELACCGTLMKHIDAGAKVGVADLTEGELGSRGSAAIRLKESANAAEYMQLDFRVNVGLEDGFFVYDRSSLLAVIEIIRRARPKIILANSLSDRHPDHGRAAKLVAEAFFYSGLSKIEGSTSSFRADALYHYIQDKNLVPDFCVDITSYAERKRKAIECFGTQFFTSDLDNSSEPETPISTPEFMQFLFAKMRTFGRPIGAEYAEGYNVNRTIGVRDLRNLL